MSRSPQAVVLSKSHVGDHMISLVLCDCSLSFSTEREHFINLKYIQRSFVQPHPNFEPPEVPVPPPRIQGTLLRSVAVSSSAISINSRPSSAGSGERTTEFATPPLRRVATPTLSRFSASCSTSSLNSPDEDRSPSSSEGLGGLNLRPESLALLEANLKKLEKTGKLKGWNLTSKVRSPRKTFSQLTNNIQRLTRPGSFRRKMSSLVNSTSDEQEHSDNEMDESSSLLRPRASTSPTAPRKPPRTYTTTLDDLTLEETESLFPPGHDDFSTDVMSTLKELGYVYDKIPEEDRTNIKQAQSELDLCSTLERKSSNPSNQPPKLQRSVSAINVPLDTAFKGKLSSPPITENPPIPTISISGDSEKDPKSDSRPKSAQGFIDGQSLKLSRGHSLSLSSLTALQDLSQSSEIDFKDGLSENEVMDIKFISPSPDNPPTTYSKPEKREETMKIVDQIDEEEIMNDVLKENTESPENEEVNSSYVTHGSLSSLDSYVSAEEGHSPATSVPRDISLPRPDSCASELFQTPPNSTCSSPVADQDDLLPPGAFDQHLNVLYSQDTLTSNPEESSNSLRNISNVTLLSSDTNEPDSDSQLSTTKERNVSPVSAGPDDVFDGSTNPQNPPSLENSEVLVPQEISTPSETNSAPETSVVSSLLPLNEVEEAMKSVSRQQSLDQQSSVIPEDVSPSKVLLPLEQIVPF